MGGIGDPGLQGDLLMLLKRDLLYPLAQRRSNVL